MARSIFIKSLKQAKATNQFDETGWEVAELSQHDVPTERDEERQPGAPDEQIVVAFESQKEKEGEKDG